MQLYVVAPSGRRWWPCQWVLVPLERFPARCRFSPSMPWHAPMLDLFPGNPPWAHLVCTANGSKNRNLLFCDEEINRRTAAGSSGESWVRAWSTKLHHGKCPSSSGSFFAGTLSETCQLLQPMRVAPNQRDLGRWRAKGTTSDMPNR